MAEVARARWFKDRHQELRSLVWEWDPLGLSGAPEDEYDFLVDRILGALVRGASESEISEVLDAELGEPFGPAEKSAEKSPFVAEAFAWYESAPSRPET